MRARGFLIGPDEEGRHCVLARDRIAHLGPEVPRWLPGAKPIAVRGRFATPAWAAVADLGPDGDEVLEDLARRGVGLLVVRAAEDPLATLRRLERAPLRSVLVPALDLANETAPDAAFEAALETTRRAFGAWTIGRLRLALPPEAAAVHPERGAALAALSEELGLGPPPPRPEVGEILETPKPEDLDALHALFGRPTGLVEGALGDLRVRDATGATSLLAVAGRLLPREAER